jgi:hypothetical protein
LIFCAKPAAPSTRRLAHEILARFSNAAAAVGKETVWMVTIDGDIDASLFEGGYPLVIGPHISPRVLVHLEQLVDGSSTSTPSRTAD